MQLSTLTLISGKRKTNLVLKQEEVATSTAKHTTITGVWQATRVKLREHQHPHHLGRKSSVQQGQIINKFHQSRKLFRPMRYQKRNGMGHGASRKSCLSQPPLQSKPKPFWCKVLLSACCSGAHTELEVSSSCLQSHHYTIATTADYHSRDKTMLKILGLDGVGKPDAACSTITTLLLWVQPLGISAHLFLTWNCPVSHKAL